MFGYRQTDVIGQEMVDLMIPVRFREAHRRGFARFLETGQGQVVNRRQDLSALRADGTIEPAEVSIPVGQRVRFVNEHGGQHQPTSNPHLSHTDCPPLNLPTLNGGQAANTGTFDVAKVCGFHDHINPDTIELRGTIRVGGAGGPAGPVYLRP